MVDTPETRLRFLERDSDECKTEAKEHRLVLHKISETNQRIENTLSHIGLDQKRNEEEIKLLRTDVDELQSARSFIRGAWWVIGGFIFIAFALVQWLFSTVDETRNDIFQLKTTIAVYTRSPDDVRGSKQ